MPDCIVTLTVRMQITVCGFKISLAWLLLCRSKCTEAVQACAQTSSKTETQKSGSSENQARRPEQQKEALICKKQVMFIFLLHLILKKRLKSMFPSLFSQLER